MNVLRITALLLTGILLFTGCGSKAEAVNPDASATQKEAPDADGADAAFSNNEITAVETDISYVSMEHAFSEERSV